ncbi:hypothetical protein LF1_09900 [Rubripirellula obstinata]|uniref:UPF0246 protein LF1_09900 n=1 Tax=Rubripirellula obstinata TaxID=406547 RepID=A0A5B1CFW9_9BACT|nr:peroxide stress protein YaaA [Rubripirellula obstinata]KAA1258470.1 hypothetical protein LF1_09900 [Rubripirellula obstinata]
MIIVLSPAKTLDFETASPTDKTTRPALLKDASVLAEVCKQKSPEDLRQLMGISQKLAELNHQRFSDWEAPHPKLGSKAALFAFQGDVYRGLKAAEWTTKQIEYSQDHLRVLSGLYGLLRPLDRMLPYRLEMGTSLASDRGKDLYAFWGDKIAKQLRKQMDATKSKHLLNLASQEYFKSIDQSVLDCPIVSPAFKEWKNGKFKIIAIFAKLARGSMASWVVKNKVKTVNKLIQFDEDGYRYDAESSTPTVPVFVRGD